MQQNGKYRSRFSILAVLALVVAGAQAQDAVIYEGENWLVGEIQQFNSTDGVVVIGDRRYRLARGALGDDDSSDARLFLAPGREVVFRELGSGVITEIKELAH